MKVRFPVLSRDARDITLQQNKYIIIIHYSFTKKLFVFSSTNNSIHVASVPLNLFSSISSSVHMLDIHTKRM